MLMMNLYQPLQYFILQPQYHYNTDFISILQLSSHFINHSLFLIPQPTYFNYTFTYHQLTLTQFPLAANSSAPSTVLHLSPGSHPSVAKRCIESWRFSKNFCTCETPIFLIFPFLADFYQFSRDFTYNYKSSQPKYLH